jgi:tetratricopeptide (TPR) repeat protein
MADKAAGFFEQVLMADPGRVEALVHLSTALRTLGRHDDAIPRLRAALEADQQIAELWLALGHVVRETGDLTSAETFYCEALRLKPRYVEALAGLGDLLFDRRAHAEALALYDKAVKQAPQNPQLRLNRAVQRLHVGDADGGWQDYEWRLKLRGTAVIGDHGLRTWTGQVRSGMRLLVTAEQGIGDQVLFAALLPGLIEKLAQENGAVLADCEPRLEPLFARSFPEASIFPSAIERREGVPHASYDALGSLGGADAAVALGSLPKVLRIDPDRLAAASPFLLPDKAERDRWTTWVNGLPGSRTVGICWRSGKTDGLRVQGFAPLELWADFMRDTEANFVDLQYDSTPEEREALERLSGKTLHVPPDIDQRNELDRAASLMAAMGQVVSAPTAVAALAPAVGTRTVKIVFDSSWTALGRDYEPFVPACRLAKPAVPGDWADGFAQARALIDA